MESLNRMATELVDEAIDFADELAVDVYSLDGDSAVIDCGVRVPGSIEAGLLLAEIQTAGLATVGTNMRDIAGAPIPHVELSTDHPALALLCSSKAGWELSVDEFEGLGSGPARALVAREDAFERVGYREDFDFAVLVVESDQLPDEAVASHIAELAEVPESGVFMPTYASASVTGSVVGAARTAELAAYRLMELGYDPVDILSVTGSAPVAPVADSEERAMATTNDAVGYGGQAHLVVEEPFDDFADVVSVADDEYGAPFIEIFDSVDWAFDELPMELFAPAQVTVNVVGGETEVYGDVSENILADSFGL